MEFTSDKIQKEITELLKNEDWIIRDNYGEITFTPEAPKEMVERFYKLKELLSKTYYGTISEEEFDEELNKLYPKEEENADYLFGL